MTFTRSHDMKADANEDVSDPAVAAARAAIVGNRAFGPGQWLVTNASGALSEKSLSKSRGNDSHSVASHTALYESLPNEHSVRLLELQPGRYHDRIVCNLKTYSIRDQPPPYEALSYVWGSLRYQVPIICNGKMVRVTISLRDALHRVRHEFRPMLIWADAICINQDNVEERGHQVRLMGSIYKNARRVVIWAGRDVYQHARTAFPLIRMLAQYSNSDESNHEDVPSYLSPTGKKSLKAFYQIPWLRRLWVIQEVVSASSAVLLWGSAKISWKLIGLASDCIRDHSSLSDSLREGAIGVPNACSIWSFSLEIDHPSRSFRALLQECRNFDASESKDRIFALLNLPNTDTETTKNSLFIEPDYSLSVPDLYVKVARKILARDRTLALLSEVYHGPKLEQELPTWVPSWERSIVVIDMCRNCKSAATGLPEHQIITLPGQPKSLMVQGLEFDTVARITPTISDEDIYAMDKRSNISYLWMRRLQGLFGYQIEDSHLRVLGSTMAVGEDCWSNFAAWWLEINGELSSPGLEAAAKAGDIARFRTTAVYCHDRRLCLTTKGYAGLGPEALVANEMVCFLCGGLAAYILRPKEKHYQLIGEAYIHGLKQDEAARQWRKGRLKMQDFDLR